MMQLASTAAGVALGGLGATTVKMATRVATSSAKVATKTNRITSVASKAVKSVKTVGRFLTHGGVQGVWQRSLTRDGYKKAKGFARFAAGYITGGLGLTTSVGPAYMNWRDGRWRRRTVRNGMVKI